MILIHNHSSQNNNNTNNNNNKSKLNQITGHKTAGSLRLCKSMYVGTNGSLICDFYFLLFQRTGTDYPLLTIVTSQHRVSKIK